MLEETVPEIFKPFETPNEIPGPADPEQALEMSEFERYDETAEEGMEAYSVTRGGFIESGLYVPGHVEEIDPEAAEFDPEMQELANELDTWIEQKEPMSCAVASQTMAINQLEHGGYSEQELIDVARENGWYNHNGTLPRDVGKVAEAMGAEVERRRGVDPAELTMANDPSVKVLANIDSTLLLFPECDKRCKPDHCVQVLRVEDTEQGQFVILNDPGHEAGRGAVYPMEVFAKAYRGDITTIRKEREA